jgi:hypothetical protein
MFQLSISKIIFAHAEALLEDKKVFEYLLKSKKYTANLNCCGRSSSCLILNGEWDIFHVEGT